MSQPTVGILFSASTPAATAGYQIATPQTDGALPASKFNFQTPATGGAVLHTASYTAVAADCGIIQVFNSATAVTLTLPAAAPFLKWTLPVQNVGAGVLTINRNGLLIDTVAANLTLAQASGVNLATDATNYLTMRGLTSTAGLATQAGVQQESYTYATDTGTANAYAVTLSPVPTIVAGSTVAFKAANGNSGASTLTVNGGTATAIHKNGSSPLVTGDVLLGQIVHATYDGTYWQISAVPAATVLLPNLRGSTSANTGSSSTTSSLTVALPAGSAVGDFAVLCIGAITGFTIPTGWTALAVPTNFVQSCGGASRILTSGDISTGSVAVAFGSYGGSYYDASIVLVVYVGATGGIREIDGVGSSGVSFYTQSTTSAVQNTDAALYFAFARGNTLGAGGINVVPSSGSDTVLANPYTTGLTGSGMVVASQAMPGGAFAATFNWPGGETNFMCCILVVEGASTGVGSVTSVGLTMPSDFTVTGSPVTGAGTFAVTGGVTKAGIQQESYTYSADTGVANAYAVTLSPVPTLVAGSSGSFIAVHANTGASTLAINGGTAIAIKKNGNSTALASGDIAANQIIDWTYDGTVIQILVPGSGGGGTSVNVNGSSVSSPNFNPTTPAAPSGSQNVAFQVSGSSVSSNLPAATSSLLGAVRGDGTTITNASGVLSANGNGMVSGSFSAIALTGTIYLPFGGGGISSTTEANVDTPAPQAATVSNFYVQLSAAPGTGNSVAVTVRKNGAATAVTCTISGSATSGNDTMHSFTCAAGDLLDVQLVPSGTIVATPNVITSCQWGASAAGGVGSLPAYIQPSTAVPTVASLTAVNQSTSTAIDSAAGIFMHQPFGATQFLFALLQTAPATPWTFTAALIMQIFPLDFMSMGLCFSDGTKIVTCGVGHHTVINFESFQWNSATSFSASTLETPFPGLATPAVLWLRLQDNGTNRVFSYSLDGVNFIALQSTARTTFLTATKLGLFMDCQNSTSDAYMTCSSWLVTSP
jgi:hypothetical protein